MTAPLSRQFEQRAVPDWRASGWVDSYRPSVPSGSQRPFHQMTVEEFTNSKGTLFHGTVHPVIPYEHGHPMAVAHDLPQTTERSAGVHIGTQQAAEDRLKDLQELQLRNRGHADEGHVFPVRIREDLGPNKFTGRDAPRRDRGDDWRFGMDEPPHIDERGRESLIEPYVNETEDIGSTSWRVPRRQMLMTLGDHIRAAGKRGEWVNPVHARMAADPRNDTFFTVPETEPMSLSPSWRTGQNKKAA